MDKNWYIFKDGHHLGPFTIEGLRDKYHKRLITDREMVWCEGASSWRPLDEWEEIREIAPEIPPSVNLIADLKPVKGEVRNASFTPDIPDLPVDLETISKLAKDYELEEEEIETEDEGLVEVSSSSKKNLFILFLLFSFSIPIAAFFYFNKTSPIRIKGLAEQDTNRLLQITTLTNQATSFEFALTRVGNDIVMSSSKKGPAQVYITLESIPGKMLGVDSVKLKSEGALENHTVVFSDFIIEKGTKIIPGYYKLSVVGIDTGPVSQIIKYLKDNELFSNIKFISTYSDRFSFNQDFLFFKGEKSVFDKNLLNYRKEKLEKTLGPFQDLLEAYKTFIALLDKSFSIYKEKLKIIKSPKNINIFEKDYGMNVGPILQGLIVDNIKSMQALGTKNKDLTELYNRVIDFGKQVGMLASDMVTETSKVKRFKKNAKEKLEEKFNFKVNSIKQQGQSIKDEIMSKIAAPKSNL